VKPGKDPLTKEVLRVTKAKAKQPKSKKALLLTDIKVDKPVAVLINT
jgi:hypothetical protein